MGTQSQSAIRSDREAQFIKSMAAFMRRDFAVIEDSMRSDVVMELPGSSWLAGSHQGFEDVSRCILGLRQVLSSEHQQISFLHQGDQMIVRHGSLVRGPEHEVEMALRVKVRYDDVGKASAISLEPDDLALFDHVLNSRLGSQSTA
jgi:ketosteroid isomerase-like protein